MVKVVIVIVSTIVAPIVSEAEVGEAQDQDGENEFHIALSCYYCLISLQRYETFFIPPNLLEDFFF